MSTASPATPRSPKTSVKPPPVANPDQVKIVIDEPKKERQKDTKKEPSKFKPPDQKGILDELCFAPYARNVAVSMQYLLVMCGIVTLSMAKNVQNLGPGIYAILVAVLIYVWHFISDFNKVDKTSAGMLDDKGWHPIVCKVLTVLNHNAVAFVGTLLLSGYLFACVQTAIAGGGLVFSSFLYMIALIRREKTKAITGLI
jgi:hypothetical protein